MNGGGRSPERRGLSLGAFRQSFPQGSFLVLMPPTSTEMFEGVEHLGHLKEPVPWAPLRDDPDPLLDKPRSRVVDRCKCPADLRHGVVHRECWTHEREGRETMDEAVDSVIGQLLRPSAFKVHEPIQPIKVGDADARSTASVIVSKGGGVGAIG